MTKDKSVEEIFAKLREPFDPKFLKWRVGATQRDKTSGIALAFLDAREVMKRLDSVCGIENWQTKNMAVQDGFICEIGIKIDNEWIWKSNTGENSAISPVKGGASDAFKRAAVLWGIGRYLYYLKSPWVPIKPQGKSYVIADINALNKTLPKWALPNPNGVHWEDQAEESVDESNLGFEEIEAPEVLEIETVATPPQANERISTIPKSEHSKKLHQQYRDQTAETDIENVDPETFKKICFLGKNLGLTQEVSKQTWAEIEKTFGYTRGKWNAATKEWSGTKLPHESLRQIIIIFCQKAGVPAQETLRKFGLDALSDLSEFSDSPFTEESELF